MADGANCAANLRPAGTATRAPVKAQHAASQGQALAREVVAALAALVNPEEER